MQQEMPFTVAAFIPNQGGQLRDSPNIEHEIATICCTGVTVGTLK